MRKLRPRSWSKKKAKVESRAVIKVGTVRSLTLGSGGQACDDSCSRKFRP